MNVLNCLPKLSQPKAKAAIHNVWQAETKVDAEKVFDLFIETYEPQYPKASLCLKKDWIELMAFSDFPAQHWQSSAPEIQLNPPSPRSVTAPSAQRAACHAMACCT